MHILNNIFNKIFVITTIDFDDRIANMKNVLAGIDYEFFYGTSGKDIDIKYYQSLGSKMTRGQMGCSLSHIQLYQKILDENINNVLILEDDCIFTEHLGKIDIYKDQLPKDYFNFYLGFAEYREYSRYSKNLYKANIAPSHTHAISPSRSCLEIAVEINKNLWYPADGVFNAIQEKYRNAKYYLANPMIALQNNNGSTSKSADIDKTYGHF